MTPRPIDWERERLRAAQHSQATLAALARRAGWAVSSRKGKGSHMLVTRPGIARPVVIQSRMYREAALRVLDQLREGSDL
jgi:hypothetical protein